MNIFKRIWTSIQVSDNDEFIKAIEKRDKEIQELNNEVFILTSSLTLSDETINNLIKTREELYKEITLLQPKDTDIDKYCKENFTIIKPIAYKDKMKFNEKKYSVFLHELITPEAYEVKKLFKGITDSNGRYTLFKKYADKVASILTWTDDKNLDKSGDLYLYPSQSIAIKNCDCEDHSYLLSSADEEIAVGYGFYYPEGLSKPQNKFGHAFNIFIHEGKMYILESTGNSGEIEEYTGTGHYSINYIITRKGYYEINGSIHFGELAGW